MQNGTLSVTNNICLFSPTNITTFHYVRLTQRMTTRVMPIQGHTYYMNCKVKSNINLPIIPTLSRQIKHIPTKSATANRTIVFI